VQSAPAEVLSATLAAAAVPGAALSSTSTLIQSTLQLMALSKTKTIVAVAAGILLTTSTATLVVAVHGFGVRPSALAAVLGGDDESNPHRIVTQGLNKAHRIPGALYTYPEGDASTRRHVERIVEKFRTDLDPADAIKSDRDVTSEDLTNRTVYVYGSPSNHALLQRFRTQLPIVFEADGVVVGNRKCLGPDVGAIFVCPNPVNPEHRFVVYGTVTPGALRQMNTVFHGPTDYVVFNDTTRRLEQEGYESRRCFLLAGAFDASREDVWAVDPSRRQAASGEVAAATRGVIVPHPNPANAVVPPSAPASTPGQPPATGAGAGSGAGAGR
jgi:hypothetical protein